MVFQPQGVRTGLKIRRQDSWKAAGSRKFLEIEAKSVTSFASVTDKKASDRITSTRMKGKALTTSKTSEPSFAMPYALDYLGFMFEAALNSLFTDVVHRQLEFSSGSVTIPTVSTKQAAGYSGSTNVATLFYSTGYNSALVDGGFQSNVSSVTAGASVAISFDGSTISVPSEKTSSIEYVGVRGASAAVGEIAISTVSEINKTLTLTFANYSPANMLLEVGQSIYIGNPRSIANRFADDKIGLGRVVGVTATSILVEDVRDLGDGTLLTATDTGNDRSVDVLVGRYIKNGVVGVDGADTLYQIEGRIDPSEVGTDDLLTYAEDMVCNELSIKSPAQDLLELDCSFMGRDITIPTPTAPANALSVGFDRPSRKLEASSSSSTEITFVDDSGQTLQTVVNDIELKIANNTANVIGIGSSEPFFIERNQLEIMCTGKGVFDTSQLFTNVQEEGDSFIRLKIDNKEAVVIVELPYSTLKNEAFDLSPSEHISIGWEAMAYPDPISDIAINVTLFPFSEKG